MIAKAKINAWLDVGDCTACPDDGYGMCIHIFRRDTHERQERCCVYPDNRHNLRVDYRDGEIIDPSNLKNLASVADILRSRLRPTLVHCHAGMCRSPTIAIYLLCAVEDMHPYEARELVTKSIYEQRSGIVCDIAYNPFKQIVRLWEAGAACRMMGR